MGGHKAREGDRCSSCAEMSHRESVCTRQKDSVVPVTSKTRLASHPCCYTPLWRKSKEVLQPFPSGSQLCNSMSSPTKTLGSFLPRPRYLVDNLKDKEVSELFDEFQHFHKSI